VLVHEFDAAQGASKVPELLRRLADLSIDFKDLQTEQSSLEDIFVDLVHGAG
jgi:ABC-2 type transport system ATP-binding protein